jgi:hypothetical protein
MHVDMAPWSDADARSFAIDSVPCLVVLWPPPSRGDSVALDCGCAATVILRLRFLFLYRIRIRVAAESCRRRHQAGSTSIVRLEKMNSRTNL